MLFEPEKIKYEHIIEAAKTIDYANFKNKINKVLFISYTCSLKKTISVQ
jgi:hypothetical protein